MSLFYRFLSVLTVVLCLFAMPVAAEDASFDILYLESEDLEKILDYHESLSGALPPEIVKKIRVMGVGDDHYALVYDCNESGGVFSKSLFQHIAMLQDVGLIDPLGIKNEALVPIYNISYGIGPNLEPLKKRYTQVYKILGDEAAGNLVIEKTDSGNYVLVLHVRGRKKDAAKIVRKHKKLLRRKKFTASLAPENCNEVVYGESSHIDEARGTLAVQTISKERSKELHNNEKKPKRLGKSSAKKHIKARKYVKYHHDGKVKVSPKPGISKGLSLEKSIERHIDALRRKGRIRGDETTGWMVYDLAQNRSLVDINANKSFQAASMIKPFVALAFFHKVKKGKLKYGSVSRRKMELMIQRSNNAATNWIMKRVGGPVACNKLLHASYPAIFRNTHIREYIPKGGRTYRNSASPADYVRFLQALWDNKLPRSRELRRLMALPGRDRIYNGTPIPRGTLVYNKTGSTAHLIGDMGILVLKTKSGRRYPYVIVGIIQRRSRPSNYGRWMDSRGNIIRQVSTLVYKKMKRDHKLR